MSSTPLLNSASCLVLRRLEDLHQYQTGGVDWLFELNRSLIFADPGAGKTVMTATAVTELLQADALERVLIVAPKRVALITWPKEFEKWEHLRPWLPGLAVATGKTPKQRQAIIEGDARIVLINYDLLPWLFKTYPKLHGFDGIVFDEITRMKNYMGVRVRAYRKRINDFKWRTGLTGTPTANGLEDLFGQVWCIDKGQRLGKTKGGFKEEFMTQTGYNDWDWSMKPGAAGMIMNRLSDLVYQVENYDGLPDFVPVPIEVSLGPKARDFYIKMETEGLIELDEVGFAAANSAVVQGKLEQIVQGFLYHEGGQTWDEFDTAKLDALAEVVESLQGDPLFLAYKFRADLARIQKRWMTICETMGWPRQPLPYLGAGITDKEAARTVDAWNAGDLPLLPGHPQSVAHGLNMQDGGKRVGWYALTWSWEEHKQFNMRVQRQGQESDRVWGFYFHVPDTVDDDKWHAVNTKGNTAQTFREGIRARIAARKG